MGTDQETYLIFYKSRATRQEVPIARDSALVRDV